MYIVLYLIVRLVFVEPIENFPHVKPAIGGETGNVALLYRTVWSAELHFEVSRLGATDPV
jgi:hypothetical protein